MDISKLTTEQKEILLHTKHRAAQGLYVGSSPDMLKLEALGLMKYRGRVAFCPDTYWSLTYGGEQVVAVLDEQAVQA